MRARWNLAILALGFFLLGSCSKDPGPADSGSNGSPVASPDTQERAASDPDDASLASNERGLPGVEEAASSVPLSQWPRYHGPDGNNHSPDTGLLTEWPEQGPKLAWSATGIGHGFSSVTLADGLLYTDGNLADHTVITALDLEGNVRWQVKNGPAWTGSSPGTRGTPTIDQGRIYHESPLGEVVCLDGATGEKIWGQNVLETFGAKNIAWALAESLLVDGDRVICSPGGGQVSLVALDKTTGQTVWQAPSTGDQTAYASPILAEHQGLRMILAMNAKALFGVNAENGALLFRHEHLTEYDVHATNPIFHNGQVFISSGYGSGSEMLELTVDGTRVQAERVWQSKELDNQHGGVIRVGEALYGASDRNNSGKWICLDWSTGDLLYAEQGAGKGSATFADGMFYVLSERRDVGLVEATPKGHAIISRFKLPVGGEGRSWAHPVVCGGRLYLRHGDTLYAYEVQEGPPQ